ncbi:hypothetical protein [Corynebacterium flavescens]|uniref:hypothetical protein n=1 Tax=Corynebacterium flavescens TaxID=28028 RepID=UPI003FD09C4B
MPTISGSLKYVTDRPAAVTEVWVRAKRLRTSGDGVVTSSNDRIPVADGQVSFDALPGPAVLALVESGRPVETIPLIVGDADEQSLQLVVNAGQLAESDDVNVLEQLAQQVSNDVVRAQDAAEASSSSATAARTSETNAKTSETNSAKSEENAKASETNAAESATTAGEEADRANTEADCSGESADAANVSKEAAESASTNASEKAEQTNGDREASESAAADAKSEADRAKTEADRAKDAADHADGAAVEAVTARVNTLLEGAPEAYDTLREVGEKLAAQDDVASALTSQIAGKADKSYVDGIQVRTTNLETDQEDLADDLQLKANKSDVVPSKVVSSMPSSPVVGTLYFVTGA